MFKMWFQELLNECIDIQEHQRILNIFKQMSLHMNQNKKELVQSTKQN